MSETFRVWVTKYALSGGIDEREVTRSSGGDDYVYYGRYHASYRLGRDAHLTLASALADAEKRRAQKIASLKKQITKLEKLRFGPAA